MRRGTVAGATSTSGLLAFAKRSGVFNHLRTLIITFKTIGRWNDV